MAKTPAEKQRDYRARQKSKRAAGDPKAIEQWERKKECDRDYYAQANKDELNAAANKRYHKRMESDLDYRQKKRDEARLYVERHPEKVAIRRKMYRERTVEQRADYMAQWEKVNPDKRKAINLKRLYLMEDTMVEPIDRWVIWDRDEGVCGICGKTADSDDWHLDHITPLSKGGSHTFDNVQVSHPLCNIRKGNKLTLGGESHRY